MNTQRWIAIAAALGGLAVIIGAFGAHGLESRLDAHALEVYHTGVTYHFYHALAMLALALSGNSVARSASGRIAALCWLVGVLIFSGSLYALAITGITWLGAITPIGGLAFIVGWFVLAIGALRTKRI